jgi:endonuclease/exonuclease/phosphatase family metal-dependent hydrolase
MLVMRLRVLLLIVLAGCASASTSSLRLMTYNIHAGKDAGGVDNLERVAAIVKANGADIVLLQEVDRNTTRSGNVDQIARLAQLTGMHSAYGKAIDFQGGAYGIAMLSRWPISANETVPLHNTTPVESRVTLLATIDTPAGPLRIANTHLDASREDRHRMEEVPQFLSAANGVLAGGDFNSTPDSSVHAAVLSSGYRDAFSECGAGNELTYPASPPQKRIDYVFLSAGLRCSSASVLDTDASDHRPLLVTINR